MIYVHIPFCRSFCTYCDFYSERICRGEDGRTFSEFVSELVSEAGARREEIVRTLALNTLYIGGGTPSVLPLSLLRKIVEALPYGPFEEFTIEVNPDDIVEKGKEYVRGLLDLGVNRISMGVQSLDDGILRWMNRRHDGDGARRAFGILRDAGVENVSVDIITGLSQLTDETLSQTLSEIVSWRPEHISAYQLSIEEGSALARMTEDGRYVEASEEHCRSQYDRLCAALAAASYEHYEISNWALPGFRSRHNSAYWRRLPYVGLGPGAHSLRGADRRSWNSSCLSGWTSSGETLNAEQIREETLMLGLRTKEGVCGKLIPEKDWFVADSIIADML